MDANGQAVTGIGIKIAIIDTGIDYTHSALGACIGSECKVLGGYDFVNNDDDPMDDNGHGTHVAGIAAANSENIKGVAPEALLYAYKAMGADGSGWETDIIAAIEAAVDPDGNPSTNDAVDIINLSLGGIDNGSSLMDDAAKSAVEIGVAVVVAAGNDGISPNFSIDRNSLANEPSVITVGATTKQDTIAYFSSIGNAETTTHLKPEISAPGYNILSTELNNSLVEKSGTSMAAPHVAGAAALILQTHPEASPELLKRMLMAGAIDLGESPIRQGVGRIDVEKSLNAQFIVETDLIHLGKLTNTDTNSWSIEKTFTITNISDEVLTIQLTKPNNYPSKIKFELSETDISLAANSSIVLTLHAEINDVINFPFPNNGSYIYFDSISIKSSSQTYQLPVILDRSYSLNIVNSSNENISLSAFPFNGNFNFSEEIEPHSTKTIPVAFEKALIKVQYGNSFDGMTPKPDWMDADAELVGYELFTTNFINGQDSIELGTQYLTQIIGVGEINSSEFDVNLSELETKSSILTFDGEFHYSHSDSYLHGDLVYYQFGRISPDVSVNYQSIVNFKNDDLFNDNKSHYYSIGHKVEELNQDSLINLNIDTDTHYEIQLDEIATGVESLIPRISVYGIIDSLPKDRDGFVFHTMETSLSEKFYIEIGLERDSDHTQVSSTGRMWFTNDGLHKVLTNDDYNIEKSLLTIKDNVLEVSAKGTFFNPQISKLAGNKIKLTSTAKFKGSVAFVQDLSGNLYSNSLNQSYIWQCDDEQEELSVPHRGDYEFSIELTSSQNACTERSLTISFDSFLGAMKSRSSVKLDLETSSFSEFPSFSLQVISGNDLVTNQIVNKANSVLSLVSDKELTQDLQAYIRLDSGEWIELAKIGNNSFKLPINYGSFTADIKLVATGYEQTLNELFYIGSEAGETDDIDTDGDGISNNVDPDDDNDGVEDYIDAFPLDDSETMDTDGDGIGNNADTDDDGDGVEDTNDAFPLDASESLDTDSDGIGNNTDTDDDGDGVEDTNDAFPLDVSESLDTDSDGIGNNADTDDDGDGVEDSADAFPLDASESLDTDSDGIGNNADTDDDGDGVNDTNDAFPLDSNKSAVPETQNPSNSGGGGSSSGFIFLLLFMSIFLRKFERRKYAHLKTT